MGVYHPQESKEHLPSGASSTGGCVFSGGDWEEPTKDSGHVISNSTKEFSYDHHEHNRRPYECGTGGKCEENILK